jgi:imidazolonepropionase-like amidohydrolase
LADARRYRTARNAEGKNGVPTVERDPRFEAMLLVLDGKAPLFVRADRERDIRAAVQWAKNENLRMVLVGGQQADRAADLLARENISVILGPVLNLPQRFDDPYDDAYTLPARLHKAGVRFCLSTGDASNVRRLPHNAAMASAFGLPADEALKAITLRPAQILGVADRVGSLEVGKDATFILTTGDPLEITSDVKAAYLAGQSLDLSNKHLRLYQKYRARPKR